MHFYVFYNRKDVRFKVILNLNIRNRKNIECSHALTIKYYEEVKIIRVAIRVVSADTQLFDNLYRKY